MYVWNRRMFDLNSYSIVQFIRCIEGGDKVSNPQHQNDNLTMEWVVCPADRWIICDQATVKSEH